MIRFSCPSCQRRHRVPEESRGNKLECHCGLFLLIPGQPGEPARAIRRVAEDKDPSPTGGVWGELGVVVSSILGLIVGGYAGYLHAVATVGPNANIGGHGDFSGLAHLIDPCIGGGMGVFVGGVVGWMILTRNAGRKSRRD